MRRRRCDGVWSKKADQNLVRVGARVVKTRILFGRAHRRRRCWCFCWELEQEAGVEGEGVVGLVDVLEAGAH